MAEVPELTTERLLLRGFRPDDFEAFAAVCGDEEVMSWLGGAKDRGTAWRYMATLAGHWDLRGFGRWVVEERASGRMVGWAGLWFPDPWPGVELGWTIARDAWGRGYATEAARAALDWSWSAVEAPRIISLIEASNERSHAVARKLGSRPTDERFHVGETTLTVWEILRPG